MGPHHHWLDGTRGPRRRNENALVQPRTLRVADIVCNNAMVKMICAFMLPSL